MPNYLIFLSGFITFPNIRGVNELRFAIHQITVRCFYGGHSRKLKDSIKPKLAMLTRREHITFNLKQSHFYIFFSHLMDEKRVPSF